MTHYDIAVIGELNPDLILTGAVQPAFGQVEQIVDDATLAVGSSGAIFACGAARLGLRVVYCGLVGDDEFGRYMLDQLRAHEVGVDGVIVDPAVKTGLSVILSLGDDRAILTHLGSMAALRADQVDRSVLASARHVHVTSFFLQHALRPSLPLLLATAHAMGSTVSMDTNWDPSERWNDGLTEALRHVDVFLPNEQEAIAISGAPSLEQAMERLNRRIPTVVVKQGAAGAAARQDQASAHDPGFHVRVVDTTGAGDSFNAGYLYGHLQGWALSDALALGCACGALSTRGPGGVGTQPTLAEAQLLISQRR
jgi:sugar/nucleoside kinase (ribokinase family)